MQTCVINSDKIRFSKILKVFDFSFIFGACDRPLLVDANDNRLFMKIAFDNGQINLSHSTDCSGAIPVSIDSEDSIVVQRRLGARISSREVNVLGEHTARCAIRRPPMWEMLAQGRARQENLPLLARNEVVRNSFQEETAGSYGHEN